MLAALLIDVSRELVAGADEVVASAASDDTKLRELIAFHVDFAVSNADVILVQDRDLDSLRRDDLATVRSLQRGYIEAWVGVLASIHPDVPVAELRIRARATFGLINSTPHSARSSSRASVRSLLESMALAALTGVGRGSAAGRIAARRNDARQPGASAAARCTGSESLGIPDLPPRTEVPCTSAEAIATRRLRRPNQRRAGKISSLAHTRRLTATH